MDNNCWYLFGTRIKSDLSTIRPFKDNSSNPKWVILSSDDELEEAAGKENKCERKKIKLGTGNDNIEEAY